METKNCTQCSKNFTVYKEDKVLYAQVDAPIPEKCPRCRTQYLLAFWNFGKFRKTTSALSGKSIITTLPESAPFPIYEKEEWNSDAWDPMDYGRDYDPSRSFLEQVAELQAQVPHPHQSGTGSTNSPWADDIWNSKNCYLTRSILENEDLFYGYRVYKSKNSIDITYSFECELSHDLLYCFKCYKVRSSIDSRNCIDSMFLYDCRNVENSFMCWNLRNKQYCILNQQYTKEEYFKKRAEFNTSSREEVEKLKKQFEEIIQNQAIHRENSNTQCTNTTGNFLTELNNCHSCAFYEKSENCRYSFRGISSKDSIDTVGGIVEKSATTSLGIWLYDTLGILYSANCRYSSYLDMCIECEYCFGCVGLKKKKYCILNKQYTKEEYEKLVEKIKTEMKTRGEWGQFFPLSMAYGGYNLSLANIHYPATKEEVLGMGARWEEANESKTEGTPVSEIPDTIGNIPDSITNTAFICPKTGYRFNIAPAELAFYREFNIPLPKEHADARTLTSFKRLALAIEPHEGTCLFCKKDIHHYYPSKFGYKKIACVECYQKKVA